MADSRSMGSGMQDSDAVHTANAQALMQIKPACLHKDIIVTSMLWGWCKAHGKSFSKSQRLFKKMFRKFREHKVISPAHIEALKQFNYNILWSTLMSLSISSSSDDSPDVSAVLPFRHKIPPSDQDHTSHFQQRYKEDFIQIETIGEGGFGKVYKVQHKLDKKYYAVKKIKVTKRESDSLQREIQTLAHLNHPNIVRYHQSWFEKAVTQQSDRKQPLMLRLRSINDMDEEEEEEEEGKEQEGVEKDGDDSFYAKSKNKYSCQEHESISKFGSPSPIITEVVETRSQHHSQQTRVTVSMNQAEMDQLELPCPKPNFTVPFEDERFDSGELVKEFFSQTSENVENIKHLACKKKEEELSNTDFNVRRSELDRKTDSLKSSGTSGSAVTFQNVQLGGRNCDLKEQNSSRVEFIGQLRSETSSKSDCYMYKEIKITATTNSKKKGTLIPTTSATAALLSATTSLSSSTHIHNRIRDAPSISWRPSIKSRFYLYIQMELCSSTLRTWLNERNEKISKTESQFDVVNEKQNQNIYKQILEGMKYIHSQGILHRDVTPKNIFLSHKDDGLPLVKIGDFGLAREDVLTEPKTPMRFQRDQDLDGPCVSKSYTSGIGTVEYVAPEQFNESTYDNKCDMFSVGMILLELYHPFRRICDRHKCFEKVYEGNIPEELQKRWPVQYSAIQSLTSHDSAKRPSASDLLSGGMFPPKDKIIIESQADEIQKLKKLLAERDAEISQLKENGIPKM